MAAVLDAVSEKYTIVSSPRKRRDYSYLKPYQFKPGQVVKKADGTNNGRPEGRKDALTAILESAPLKARQYIKSTAPGVLVDARKWIMPIESDKVGSSDGVNVLAFLAQHLTLIAPPVTTPLQLSLPASETPEVT